MMGYEHDVFISYPRRGETQHWVAEHFVPALQHALSLELDREPKLFFDLHLEQGSEWNVRLGQKISRSRVLVCLWTRNYLLSEWCKLEISHMLARERDTGRRSGENPIGLISIPILHDGETIPDELQGIQHFKLHGLFNPRMRKDSIKSEQLYDVICSHAAEIANQIEMAPLWQKNWIDTAVEDFVQLFRQQRASVQNTTPRYTS